MPKSESIRISTAIATARDFHAFLIRTATKYLADADNVDLALQLAVVAWSMPDWAFRDYRGRDGYPDTLSEFQAHLRRQCPELEYMQALATQHKHAEIRKFTPNITGAVSHVGEFSNDFGSDFDVSGILVCLTDGTEVDFANCVEAVLAFWQEYFETLD